MPSNSDTLDFSSVRPAVAPTVIMPDATARPENLVMPSNPASAEAARARIAAMSDDTFHPAGMPVTTTPLQTDKVQVAAVAAASPAPLVGLAPARTWRERLSPKRIPEKIRPVATAAAVFLVLLLLLKSPIIVSQLQYTFNKPDTAAVQSSQAAAVVSQDPTISIPKIGVSAPVVYEPSVEEASVQKALESGVVHYGNTPVPGVGGNAVIFGHSSNDWWEPGNYKFIFGLLEKIAVGDQFTADYKGVRYTYEVTGTKTVAPTDVSVLNPTSEPTMTLITCTPVGTSLNRFVVTAKQVSPNPSAVAQTTDQSATTGTATTLPGESTTGQNGVAGFFSKLLSVFGLGGDDSKPALTPSTLPSAK